MSDYPPLLPLLQSYVQRDPRVAAHALEAMSEEEAREALAAMPASLAGRIFPHLQTAYAATLLRDADDELMDGAIAHMEAKRVAAIVAHLPAEARERFIPHLNDQLRYELREQLQYPEDSVGRIMTRQFLAFQQDAKVEDVTRKLRDIARRGAPSSYVYVLGEGDRLVGVLNMYRLLLAAPEQSVGALMQTDVFALDGFTPCEEAAAEIARRRYFAVPVVDGEGRMLGLVRSEDLLQGLQQDVAGDILKMVGASSEERTFSPFTFSLRKRLPWLHLNLLTAFMAAAVVAMFEDLIAQITVLAVFLSVVAGQGGNAGAQSLAIVMRGLVMREIPPHRRRSLVLKEGALGAINGAVTGLVTALLAWMWYGNPMLGVVVGLAMVVNLLFAGLAGASIPLVMKALRLDPAQCSSIILTTVTDVVGFFAFLGLAMLFRDFLV